MVIEIIELGFVWKNQVSQKLDMVIYIIDSTIEILDLVNIY